MSTQGKTAKRWLDVDVVTEVHYYDGDPRQTTKSFTARVNALRFDFTRWPADRFTRWRDWRVYVHKGYVIGRTPWGNWEVGNDSWEYTFESESGDTPWAR